MRTWTRCAPPPDLIGTLEQKPREILLPVLSVHWFGIAAFSLCGVCGACAAAWLAVNLYVGLFARIVPRRKIRPGRNPLQQCQRAYRDITVTASDGIRLCGWYVPGNPGLPTVVICHPYESSKYASLHRLGLLPPSCPALLFDGRAHGQSGGAEAEFMRGESLDVTAILDYAERELGLSRFVLWGRCWSGIAVANLAAQRPKVIGLILEGSVSSLWEASTETLRQVHDLPPWSFFLGILLLQRRWGRGFSYKMLDALGPELEGKEVLLVSEAFHTGSVRYAQKLRAAWPRVRLTELCLPTLHGGITDLAATLGPYRSQFSEAIHALLARTRGPTPPPAAHPPGIV